MISAYFKTFKLSCVTYGKCCFDLADVALSLSFLLFFLSSFKAKMEHRRIAEDEIELLPFENNETDDNESERIVLKPSPWYIIIPMFTITFAYGYTE